MYDPSLQLGIAALLFGALIIFYLSMRIQASNERARWKAEMELRDKKHASDKSMLESLIEKNYDILKGALQDSRDAVLQMTKLVERVRTMQQDNDTAFRDLFQKTETLAQRPRCADALECKQPKAA